MKVFIGGARQLRSLNKNITERLDNIYQKQFEILIGDATGIDEEVQKYYFNKRYDNVIIYASNGKVRHNVGNWEVKGVEVPKNVTGFDFYAAKDLQMSNDADYGFMIWNGKSKGTWNNICNLTNMNKPVLVYVTTYKRFFKVTSTAEAEKLKEFISKKDDFESVNQINGMAFQQLTLF